MIFGFNNKKNQKKSSPEKLDGQEVINWSSTEGYDAVRQVNNRLRWPSVWGGSHDTEKTEKPKRIEKVEKKKAVIIKEIKPKIEVKPEKVVKINREKNQHLKENAIRLRKDETELKSDKFKNKEEHRHSQQKEKIQVTHEGKFNIFEKWKQYQEAKKLKKINWSERKKIKRFADALKPVEELIDKDEYLAKEDLRLKASAKKISQMAAVVKPVVKIENKQTVTPAKITENTDKKIEKIVKDSGKQRVFTDLKKNFEQKSWNKPSITETNLASGRTTLYFNWTKFWLALVQWLVVTLFFIALCGSLLYLWQQKQRRESLEVSQRFSRIDQLINLTENEVGNVLDFRGRLIVVNNLLSNHIYWNNFFSFLEKNTLPNVFYEDFSGDTSGEYLLKARTDSFDSMAKQLKVFRRAPEVLEVSSEGGEMIKVESKNTEATEDNGDDNENKPKASAKKVTNQLTFSIKLKIKPEIFLR
ncbi:MAG TPA: hypothetical protein PKN62_02455 [bacterium]|mgnify:CR=1 FL=1|nr:hypothetical protein [bacterium]